MGCRQQEQRPEENDIYIFFHKMEKEAELNYTIEDYEKNYDKISQLSKNKFKKLEKKQSVRIGFVNEIMKTLNKLNISEREDRITRKILFYTLVLTLTLKNFLKENENNIYIKSNNDLQQSLLTMAVQTLKNKFDNEQNLKLIIYYIAKMLILLFKEMKDIDQYLNIKKYIKTLNSITKQENTLEEKEIYPFLKVNLSCLGEYFVSNYKENNNLELSSIEIITNYFITVIFAKTSFISENYTIYKNEIFSENYLFNINEQINNKKKYYDLNSRKKTIASIKNIDNLIDTNKSKDKEDSFYEEKNEDINQTDDTSKLRNDQNFLDLIEINESFYYFFKSVIHDISGGKNIFGIYNYHINDFIIKKSNDMRVNTKIPDFNKACEILLLLFFVKCKINGDNVIIYSFLEFVFEIMKKDFKQKDFFYNFVMIFIELFKEEKNIYDKNLKLLSHIYIIEIEKIKDNEELLIEKILNFSEPFKLDDNRLGLFISFLSNVFYILKEAQNDNLTSNSLIKLNQIFDKLNNNENEINSKNSKSKSEDESVNKFSIQTNTKNTNAKYVLNKEEFDYILKFCDFGNKANNKKTKHEYIKKKNNNLFNTYLNFFIQFLIFSDDYYFFKEIFDDITSKNLFYEKIISIITKFEIFYINSNNLYINELIILIKKMINITEKNTYNYFIDFEIIYKYLNHNIYKISKIETEEITIYHFKLIYSISIFIISQLKKIFRIPSSMQKIHSDIILEISKDNSTYSDYFNNMAITINYNDNTDNNDFYKYLRDEFSNKKYNYGKDIILTNKKFKSLIDIMHSKLFGKSSNLIVYFKSQGNILNENENENDKYKKYKCQAILNNIEKDYDFEDFDNIIIEEEKNENDTILLTVNESNNNIIDMSLRDKNYNNSDGEDDESETISKHSDTYSQNINIPENEDEDDNESRFQSRKSLIENSFVEDYTSNFKV